MMARESERRRWLRIEWSEDFPEGLDTEEGKQVALP